MKFQRVMICMFTEESAKEEKMIVWMQINSNRMTMGLGVRSGAG